MKKILVIGLVLLMFISCNVEVVKEYKQVEGKTIIDVKYGNYGYSRDCVTITMADSSKLVITSDIIATGERHSNANLTLIMKYKK